MSEGTTDIILAVFLGILAFCLFIPVFLVILEAIYVLFKIIRSWHGKN